MRRASRSRSNQFQNPGFVPGEAERFRVRSELVKITRQLIDDRQYSQEMAAIIFGVTQPRVSNLVRGRIELFSVDALIEMLSWAGVRIEIRVTHEARRGSRAATDARR